MTTTKTVINDLKDREALGLRKYGVTLNDANLTQQELVQHAYEEVLDLAVYLCELKKVLSNGKV
jgi:hypothetical protein